MFQGWYENAELTGEPVSQTTHDTAHGRVFYAKWEPETLTVPNLDDLSFVYDGQSRSLRVTLSNSGILSYQWYKNDSAIEGATDSHYEVKDVADSGSYSVFVTLCNRQGLRAGTGQLRCHSQYQQAACGDPPPRPDHHLWRRPANTDGGLSVCGAGRTGAV